MRRTVLIAVLSALLGAPAAHAAFPGQNGMLGYAHRLPGLYGSTDPTRINPDGSGQGPLLAPLDLYDRTQGVDWSPDGNRIVYTRQSGAYGEVYVANADGSGETRLSPEGVASHNPVWSPDGKRIAYRRYDGSNAAAATLWVMNADGSGQSQLIPETLDPGGCTAFLGTMDWSSADRIAFDGACNGFAGGWFIWTIDGNGTGLASVGGLSTDLAFNGAGLDWSPDGTKLAVTGFEAYLPAGGTCSNVVLAPDLWVADTTQGTAVKLTPTSGWEGPHELDPAWSPDGTQIAFAAYTNGCSGGSVTFTAQPLYRMPAGGGPATRITDPQPRTFLGTLDNPVTVDTLDSQPDWQPCIAGTTLNCTSVSPPPAPPATPAPSTPETPVVPDPLARGTSAVAAAAVIRLPSTRRCVSRRAFRISLKAPRGERLRSAVVRIPGRPPVTVTRRLTAPVILKGMPRGRWTIRIEVRTDRGPYRLTRTYRTCAARRR